MHSLLHFLLSGTEFLLGSASCQAVETEWEFLFNLRGLFLQSVGFPFDSQGPGSSLNFLLLLSHYKAIENGNQTCSLGLVGRMTCLALNIYRCGGKHIPCKIRLVLMKLLIRYSGRIMLKPGTSPGSDQVRLYSPRKSFRCSTAFSPEKRLLEDLKLTYCCYLK